MAEATRAEGIGRKGPWLGAALAGLWFLVLLALAAYPFFFPVDLRHGLIPSGYGLLWTGWSLLGLPVAGVNLFLLFRRTPKALPACAVLLVLGTCLFQCPASGTLYEKWEARYMEMGWATVKPQFEAIVQHRARERAAAAPAAEATEPFAPEWEGLEKLVAPQWRWNGKCLIFPGPVERVVFYWPQGHTDLNRVVVHDPSGELFKAFQSGPVMTEDNPALAGFVDWGGFRVLNRCRRLDGDFYFCEFRY